MRQGRPDYRDRPAIALDGRLVGRFVDAGSQSGDAGEVVVDEFAYQTPRPDLAVSRRPPGPDDRDRAGRHEVPPSLVVEKLDRMDRISQFLGVLAGAVNADAEPGDRGSGEPLLDERGTRDRILSRHKIRRDTARMLGEPLRQRLERRLGI